MNSVSAASLAAAFLLAGTVTAPAVLLRLHSRTRSSAEERVDLATLQQLELRARCAAGAARTRRFGKRAFDIAAAVFILVALAPLFVLAAMAIRLDSPGPVFYRQNRVGAGGRVFEIYKFRSMRDDAERDGPRWADPQDARVTRVGRILRKLRIDEIPQVVNVLRGEMSFVGPRPERPEFVTILGREIAYYRLRHLVKPGITGWAQVRCDCAPSVEGARRKLQYDLHYIGNFALWRDFLIVLLTIKVVLFGLKSESNGPSGSSHARVGERPSAASSLARGRAGSSA
jgi:exopolysaccharide biosynthesis polyprenyl glycosylphosphotransferase